jgi:hypothetical protein
MWDRLKNMLHSGGKGRSPKQFTRAEQVFFNEFKGQLECLEKSKEFLAHEWTMDWMKNQYRERRGDIAGVLIDRGLKYGTKEYGTEFDSLWKKLEAKNPLPKNPWRSEVSLEKNKPDLEPER